MRVEAEAISPHLKTTERLTGLVTTVALVVIQILLWNSTGGLWRDEVTSTNVVTSNPSYVELWRNNHHDSFPILFGTVLRAWTQVGLGDSDFGFRAFGFFVSLALLAAIWLNARELRIETPLLSLLLFAALPVTVRFASSIRGYGLGVFWILMCLWSVLRLLHEPTWKSWLVYALFSLAAVQTYYTNCLMVLALSIGAGTVCLVDRKWKLLGMLVGSGLISLCSMLFYLPTIRFHSQWSDMQRIDVSWGLLLQKLRDAIDFGRPMLIWLWIPVIIIAVIGAIRLSAARKTRPEEERRLSLFALVTMISAIVGSIVYFKILRVETAYWYYLPLLALCGVLSDTVVFQLVWQLSWVRWLRLLLFVPAVVWLLIADSEAAQLRMTSLDLLAERVNSRADEKDLILITHWQSSITFDKYYHGKARWMTVPELKSRKQQPYPEYKQKMTEPDALRTVLEAIEETLSKGGNVWLADAGDPAFNSEAAPFWKRPAAIPVAPLGPLKWQHPPYDYFWRNETLYFISQHSARIVNVDGWGQYQIFPPERLALFQCTGWKDTPRVPKPEPAGTR